MLLDANKKILPKEQWTKFEEVSKYWSPVILLDQFKIHLAKKRYFYRINRISNQSSRKSRKNAKKKKSGTRSKM